MVRWNELLDTYLRDIGIGFDDLSMIDGDLIKKKIREYDNNVWVRDLGKLSDRDLYKDNKKCIGGSVGYDNSDGCRKHREEKGRS